MDQEKDPESSPAHQVELDPDEEARRIILARRARFVAVALVSAGVTTAACGGQTGDRSAPQPCLSMDASNAGTGGAPQVCLGVSASGGAVPCLTIAFTGGEGGVPQPCLGAGGTLFATGGAPQPCLTPLATGGAPQPCLDIAPADAGPSDAAADAPAPAPRDAMPLPCLTPPPFIPNSGNGS